jgi:hypothetical protein
MLRRSSTAGRLFAVLLAIQIGLLAVAPSALAEDGNIWSRWAERATDREIKAEVPFVILVTLPAMLVITPIWAVQKAIEAIGDEDEE